MPEPIDAGGAQPLPGMALEVGSRLRPVTAMEREAIAHIQALADAGRLRTGDRLLVALVLDLSRTIGMGAATGKAAGVAMAARQLLDAMERLPTFTDPEDDNEWREAVAALTGGA